MIEWLWSMIYRKWLLNDFCGNYNKVLKVRGWRTALVESCTDRKTITPCFWGLK